MRVTNNMILGNSSNNINATKVSVNKKNRQMTTQKKISKPSDDPVVAVRSLRLATTLSQVNQYYEKNIPDAISWMDVTESALLNIRNIMNDARQLAVTGSTDTYNSENRKTLVTQLQSLQEQIYAEGNANYAGRTVFTGYRTDKNLTFTDTEEDTTYTITQSFSVKESLEEHRYYTGNVVIPNTKEDLENELENPDLEPTDTVQYNNHRIRLAYDGVNELPAGADKTTEIKATYVDENGDVQEIPIKTIIVADEDAWENSEIYTEDTSPEALKVAGQKTVPQGYAFLIKNTGEIVFSQEDSDTMMRSDASVDITYEKTGFAKGELRPEYYYNCTKTAGPDITNGPIEYRKYGEDGKLIHYDIDYTVATEQTITVNTEASNVFDSSIQRDISEMINAVEKTIAAQDKVSRLKEMKEEAQYASSTDQERLDMWIEAAQKEADYAEDDMKKLFSTELGKIDTYYAKINIAVTDLGCKVDSLELTQARMGDQRESVQELQSKNDDVDLSQIIIDYTAAYTAYQASLTAAGKLSETTLLNYI